MPETTHSASKSTIGEDGARAAGRPRPRSDGALADLALRQHGVVTLTQLIQLGLSPSGVRSRVSRGRLHRLHAGVYAVGHEAITGDGRLMADVLVCGPDAALSHRSNARRLGLSDVTPSRTDVTARGHRGRGLPGIRRHFGRLAPCDVTEVDGIPCTTVARTLLDLAEITSPRDLDRAVERAEQLRSSTGARSKPCSTEPQAVGEPARSSRPSPSSPSLPPPAASWRPASSSCARTPACHARS